MSEQPNLFESVGAQVAATDNTTEDEPKIVDEIESLCMNCHDNGMTRLLLTKIPFFREIVIMSFHCEKCGFKNSEIQPAGQIQQRGHKYKFKVESKEDLDRQIVKSDTCIFRVEDLDLEIPSGRGQLTNVEGILSTVARDLGEKQEERKTAAPELFEKLEIIINTLWAMSAGSNLPFTISADDPAGNSWIEPSQTDARGKFVRTDYARSAEQNEALGLAPQNEEPASVEMRPEYHPAQMVPAMPTGENVNNVDDEIVENQVYSFPAHCPGCMQDCTTNMKMVNIPHFKQVVIMSTVCDHCGYRSNEVKTGGEVPEKGRRMTVAINSAEDLSRDILKAESCALACPELSLSVEPGTLGGRFTTIEGLLTQVRDDLRANVFDADGGGGDSMATEEKSKWGAFFDKLDTAIRGELKFTIILEDPLASSYVQSLAEVGGELDAGITVEDYERTAEEEEELGLSDMKTEGYEEDHKKEQAETNGVNGVDGTSQPQEQS